MNEKKRINKENNQTLNKMHKHFWMNRGGICSIFQNAEYMIVVYGFSSHQFLKVLSLAMRDFCLDRIIKVPDYRESTVILIILEKYIYKIIPQLYRPT